MSNININVKVNQGSSSARLKQLHGQVKRVGDAAEDTAKDFKNFNRTIFGATAFVGIFTQAFRGLADTMMDGSELDRATHQFGRRFGSELPAQLQKFGDGAEAVVGPSGRFIQMVRGMTTNSIDMMAAMRAAIQLRSSGVTGDINAMAEIVARAGTAAKIAGKDSAEGIRRVTDFLKDGSLAHLQHLGLLRTVTPALKAQLAVLGSASGVMGTAVTSSFKLALGMRILREATKGQLKGQRDLRDTLQDTAQYFDHLRRTVGTFLGTAMQPLLETFVDFAANAAFVLEDIKNNKKEILFLAKAFIIGTAAVSGFVLVVGGLRLAVTALTSLVGGIPFLTVALTALAGAILFNKTSLKGLIEGLRTFGAVAQGSFQLIHSFLSDPENFAAGIGKMDKSIHDLLKRKGLLGLVQNIGRVGSIIAIFAKGTITGFTAAIDSMLDKLGSVGKRLKAFLGLDSGPWKRNWLEAAKALGEAFGKLAVGGLALWGAMKLIKGLGKGLGFGKKIAGLFGKKTVPGTSTKSGGGLFGGGPNGSKSNPFYVVTITDFLDVNQKSIYSKHRKSGMPAKEAIAKARATPVLRGAAVPALMGGSGKAAVKAAKANSKVASKAGILSTMFGKLKGVLKPVVGWFTRLGPMIMRGLSIVGRFTVIGTAIATVGTFLYGFVEGLMEAREGITKFVNSVGTWVSNLFETSPFLKKIKTAFEFLYNGIAEIFNKIREWGKTAGIEMGAMLGKMGESMHQDNLQVWMGKVNRMHHALGESLLPKGYAEHQTGPGPRAPIIPKMPEHEIEQGVMIKQALTVLKDDDKLRMQKAFDNAISSGSASGLTITPEEWVTIFSLGLDQSKKIDQMAKAGDETKKNTDENTIKSARQGVC